MKILKLGGSVITDKSRPFSIREDVIRRIAGEIKEAEQKIVVVHGGGSFGHPVAHEYQINEGIKHEDQVMGAAKTRAAMGELNQKIVEIFVESGLPAISLQTSALFICRNRRIETAGIGVLRDFLDLGMIPVLYGDVTIDKELKASVLSGDQIVVYLAKELKPTNVVLATDVDGVLDEHGRTIERISSRDSLSRAHLTQSVKEDVTGGMVGKIEELLGLLDYGVPAVIINALIRGRVRNALIGERTEGTVFEAEDDRQKKA